MSEDEVKNEDSAEVVEAPVEEASDVAVEAAAE